jgi:transposase
LKEATTPRRLLAISVIAAERLCVQGGCGACEVLESGSREAVELVLTAGSSIADVARSLGISDTTLGNWVRAQRDAAERAGDPEALTGGKRAELRRLRKENADLRTDREILRTAAANFARETMQ